MVCWTSIPARGPPLPSTTEEPVVHMYLLQLLAYTSSVDQGWSYCLEQGPNQQGPRTLLPCRLGFTYKGSRLTCNLTGTNRPTTEQWSLTIYRKCNFNPAIT